MSRVLEPLGRAVPLPPLSLILVTLLFVMVMIFSAPRNFPTNRVVTVESGAPVLSIADSLAREGVIRSEAVFTALAALSGLDARIQEGDYMFESPLSMPRVLWRLAEGKHGITQVRVRLPEGSTRAQMADILEGELDRFDADLFLRLTEDKEGYLFPDTYFFFKNVHTLDVIARLEQEFLTRIAEYEADIALSGKTTHEIITMASIIDREAHDRADQKLISGVLWSRIDIDMPLQVDAPFYFLFGKASHELTREDLAVDSPYNTYQNRGLPPGPIANPGLHAIDAALNPTPSEYLYYLSDAEGNTHFARTFEEHIENKRRFLN